MDVLFSVGWSLADVKSWKLPTSADVNTYTKEQVTVQDILAIAQTVCWFCTTMEANFVRKCCMADMKIAAHQVDLLVAKQTDSIKEMRHHESA